MTTVAIIGAGEIGGATAHALAMSDAVRRVLIVDSSASVAAGKALDIQQSGAVDGFHTRLEGTDDFSRITACSVCVIADRFGSGEWAADDALAMLTRIRSYLASAPLVFAGAQSTAAMELAAREAHFPHHRLIGSAPEAFSAAVRSVVALEGDCSPIEVSLAVLGKPPRGLVVAWSDASIAGHLLEHRLGAAQLARIEERLERLWPPGPYALGLAAARVTSAIVQSSRQAWSVLAALDGTFGVRHGVGVIPAVLSPEGISRRWAPTLNSRERARLMTALGDGIQRR